MSYVISTLIDEQVYCVYPDPEANKFKLIHIQFDSDLSKAYCSNLTGALEILKWIKKNDKDLASHEFSVQLEARYLR